LTTVIVFVNGSINIKEAKEGAKGLLLVLATTLFLVIGQVVLSPNKVLTYSKVIV
jgi:hypothetical protein